MKWLFYNHGNKCVVINVGAAAVIQANVDIIDVIVMETNTTLLICYAYTHTHTHTYIYTHTRI